MGATDYCRWVLQQQPQWSAVREITACYEALSYCKLSERQRRQLLEKLKILVHKNF